MLLAHSKCILFVTYFTALIYFISHIALHPFIIYICHCTVHPRGTVSMDDSVVDWNRVSIVAYQLFYGSN